MLHVFKLNLDVLISLYIDDLLQTNRSLAKQISHLNLTILIFINAVQDTIIKKMVEDALL